jgi:hypothetical protein
VGGRIPAGVVQDSRRCPSSDAGVPETQNLFRLSEDVGACRWA